jgi:dTDP-4-dehydrorhamnose reductase
LRLLVLGADSLLGLALTRLLQTQGVDFHALATSELDLLKQAEVVKAVSRISPTQVVNVASYSNLKAESDPEAARECDIVNTRGVSTLAEVCRHLNLPLLHHSTSFVFDGQKVHPYTEEDETNPVCRYGMSKWYGERAIRDALPLHIILRTDWLISRERPGFFQQHIDACKRNGGKLDVMNHRFSPTPSSDAARVLLGIARQVDCAAEVWGTYHYCALQPMSQEHFVEQFLQEAGKYDPELAAVLPQLQITKLPVQKPYISNTVLSTQRIFETFGIKQRSRAGEVTALLQQIYGIEEAVPDLVEDEGLAPVDPPRGQRARPKAKKGKGPNRA